MSSSPIEGFPTDIVATDPAEGSVTLTVAEAVYPLEAVYGAAYIFLDRCYVLLDRPMAGSYTVTLTPKATEADAEARRVMLGEFANELLSQAWRQKILDENRVILEAVTTQALASIQGEPAAAPSLDQLAEFDFSSDAFDDPLGIAMSWEEKYKHKTPTEAAAAPPATPAAPAAQAPQALQAPQVADK